MAHEYNEYNITGVSSQYGETLHTCVVFSKLLHSRATSHHNASNGDNYYYALLWPLLSDSGQRSA